MDKGTYSNTENHPKVLDETPKPKIQLSTKTGLPIGALPTKKPKELILLLFDLLCREKKQKPKENKGKSRTKEESTEEKKARKKAVKEERRVSGC